MAKLTVNMINNLNKELKDRGSGIRWKYVEDTFSPTAHRTILDPDNFVDSCIINCTDKFYMWLEKWFKDNYNIRLHYNNTRNIIWSWEDE